VAPGPRKLKLTFDVQPQNAMANVKITVDGQDIDGLSTEIDVPAGVEHKTVHVIAKAPGFADYTQDPDVIKDNETTDANVAFTMQKGKSSLAAAAPPVATPTPPVATPAAAKPTPPPPPPQNVTPTPRPNPPGNTPKPNPPKKKKGNDGLIDI
jgi:hypothetical protein